MTLPRRTAAAGCVALSLVALTACAGTTVDERRQPDPTTRAVRTTPGPVRTVVHNARVYPAGDSADFTAQPGVSMRISASEPRTSRSRLSSTHGYGPAHGYYVTLRITVVNTGKRTFQVSPGNFFVRVDGGDGKVTSYDGNAPYSGAPKQLDTTYVEPEQRVRAPLTFDVSHPHGRLAYAPDGTAAVVWTF